jgi:hypothetical protein
MQTVRSLRLKITFGLFVSLASLQPSMAQNCPTERLSASKAKIDETLRKLQGSKGGSLPTLDGFADPSRGPLDRYRRGYFQYSVQVTRLSASESGVRVCAKVTAWLEGNGADSGYKELASNGRLEADLFDRLKEALGIAAMQATPAAPSDVWRPGQSPSDFSAHSTGTSIPARAAPTTSDDKHLQALRQQESALEEILKSQSHPQDLVVVKQARTPITQQPAEGAKVLFYAAAQDEFQKLSEAGGWTHVQISGLSRGWIRSSLLEQGPEPPSAPSVHLENKMFRLTRDEVGLFPGDWKPLNGKQVKIFWVQPTVDKPLAKLSKMSVATALFRDGYPLIAAPGSDLAGVVIVFDSADGLLAAATSESLQQWQSGHLSTAAFWKQCWSDPADAFQAKP